MAAGSCLRRRRTPGAAPAGLSQAPPRKGCCCAWLAWHEQTKERLLHLPVVLAVGVLVDHVVSTVLVAPAVAAVVPEAFVTIPGAVLGLFPAQFACKAARAAATVAFVDSVAFVLVFVFAAAGGTRNAVLAAGTVVSLSAPVDGIAAVLVLAPAAAAAAAAAVSTHA